MCLHVVALLAIFLLSKIRKVDQKMLKKSISAAHFNKSTGNLPSFRKIIIDGNKFHTLDNGKFPSETFQNDLSSTVETETRNIENLIDKTVHGIVDLKENFMRVNDDNKDFVGELRHRNIDGTNSVDKFLKKELEAINTAVQGNVVPAILSNGHAK
jgi:hypothetical protein